MKNLQYKFLGTIINSINIEILEHGYLRGDNEWSFHNVNSPFNRLYFVLDGFAYLQNNDEKVNLVQGNIYLIPLNTTYDYICNNHFIKFYLHFKSELIPGMDIFSNIHSCISQPLDADLIAMLIKKLGSSSITDIAWCKAVFLQTIYSFLLPQANYTDEQMRTIVKYQNIFNYLKANSRPAKITLKELADQMNLSVSSLSKTFKLDTGITLKEYIKRHILQTAKEILSLEDLSVKQVAYQLGFTDEFYFSRFFKKEVGISPKEYKHQSKMSYTS